MDTETVDPLLCVLSEAFGFVMVETVVLQKPLRIRGVKSCLQLTTYLAVNCCYIVAGFSIVTSVLPLVCIVLVENGIKFRLCR